jgi:hypothetical protein
MENQQTGSDGGANSAGKFMESFSEIEEGLEEIDWK